MNVDVYVHSLDYFSNRQREFRFCFETFRRSTGRPIYEANSSSSGAFYLSGGALDCQCIGDGEPYSTYLLGNISSEIGKVSVLSRF